MKHYMSIKDIKNIQQAVVECQKIKLDCSGQREIGKQKTLGLIFMNPSLRTKISTTQAAYNLGMDIIPIDFNTGAWGLEFQDGIVMDGSSTEHVREAAAVIGEYCDVIAIRSFAKLEDKEADAKEEIFEAFKKYSGKPVINLESATKHPLQMLTDLLTIEELKTKAKPKVVLTWAPHEKALPHAVANSFIEGIKGMDYDFIITHPEGYELDSSIVGDIPVIHDQDKAIKDADFVYVKNWSSFSDYGKVLNRDKNWTVTADKMKQAPKAKVMHCLPVRRNLVLSDDVLESSQSVVIQQAKNRLYAAQYILKTILESET